MKSNQIKKEREEEDEKVDEAKNRCMILLFIFMFVRIINLVAVVIGKYSSFITIGVLRLLLPILFIIIFIILISFSPSVTKTSK